MGGGGTDHNQNALSCKGRGLPHPDSASSLLAEQCQHFIDIPQKQAKQRQHKLTEKC